MNIQRLPLKSIKPATVKGLRAFFVVSAIVLHLHPVSNQMRYGLAMLVYSRQPNKKTARLLYFEQQKPLLPPTQVDEDVSTPEAETIPGNRHQVNSQGLSLKTFKTPYFQLFLSFFLAFPLLIAALPSFPIISVARIPANTINPPTVIRYSLMQAIRRRFANKGRGDNDTDRASGLFPPLTKFPCNTEWSESETEAGTIGNTLPIYPLTGDAKKPIMAADFQPPLLSSTVD
jgi:hypothetical protein